MATRATIGIRIDGEQLANYYHHWDGYIEGGLGNDIGEILLKMKLVNGRSETSRKLEEEGWTVCNGFGEAAVKLIEMIGDCSLTDEQHIEEFNYTIDFKTPENYYVIMSGPEEGYDMQDQTEIEVAYYGGEKIFKPKELAGYKGNE